MHLVKGKVSMALLLWALQGCGDDSPSAPSPTMGNTGPGANALPMPGGSLSGRVVNAVTGSPVPGASIFAGSAGPVSADSNGGFRLESSTGGDVRVRIEASGYWTRETGIRSSSASLPATLGLLPDGNDFDLDFYDHVFRHVGEDGTHLWASEPQFEIWEGLYECTGFIPSSACEELTARTGRAPAAFLQTMRAVIGADAPRYSDGHVLGSNVVTRAHPPGTVLPRSQYVERGKITIALVERRDTWSWAFWNWGNAGSMTGGHIQMNVDDRNKRGVYSHELAHTLGFDHPLGLDRVPQNSIMRQGHGDEPTRFDLLHGRILYSRPPNNRTPDTDPASFIVNGLVDFGIDAGGEGGRSAR